MSGRVVFVGAGPGAPDLITLRGHRALLEADVVLYDSLVNEELLAPLEAKKIYVGKRCGRHSMSQDEINEAIVREAASHARVVRLKGGDSGVLGRLGEEALRLAELDIPFEIVPGVSSAIAAPAFAGIPITHRGVADSFCVVSAHRRGDEAGFSIPEYQPRTTLVLMMAGQTRDVWQPQLVSLGYPEELPVAFIAAATTPAQRVVRTDVGRAANDPAVSELSSPVMAVVGKVVALAEMLHWHD